MYCLYWNTIWQAKEQYLDLRFWTVSPQAGQDFLDFLSVPTALSQLSYIPSLNPT
jgi:hypothetical protein